MERMTDRRLKVRMLLTALTTLFCQLNTIYAQEDPEYRLEIGAGAGTITYLGDYNSNLLKGAQPWFTAVAKYKMNPRMAIALNMPLMSVAFAAMTAATAGRWEKLGASRMSGTTPSVVRHSSTFSNADVTMAEVTPEASIALYAIFRVVALYAVPVESSSTMRFPPE